MLASDGADEEKSEPGAFDFDEIPAGNAVEAMEDAFQLIDRDPHARVADGQRHPAVARDGELRPSRPVRTFRSHGAPEKHGTQTTDGRAATSGVDDASFNNMSSI